MAEQNQPPSQFAQEQAPEVLTETQQIQRRVQDFKVQLAPKSAQAVSGILENGLAKGQYTLQDLDMLVVIREELTKGIIDFNTTVQIAEARLKEIQQEEYLQLLNWVKQGVILINPKDVSEQDKVKFSNKAANRVMKSFSMRDQSNLTFK